MAAIICPEHTKIEVSPQPPGNRAIPLAPRKFLLTFPAR
jgi:hypothetical protein